MIPLTEDLFCIETGNDAFDFKISASDSLLSPSKLSYYPSLQSFRLGINLPPNTKWQLIGAITEDKCDFWTDYKYYGDLDEHESTYRMLIESKTGRTFNDIKKMLILKKLC